MTPPSTAAAATFSFGKAGSMNRNFLCGRSEYAAINTNAGANTWRASDFEMAVLAANLINRKFLIDAVPGISPWNG